MGEPKKDQRESEQPSRGLTPLAIGLSLAAAAGLFALLRFLVAQGARW